jgi:ATP-binding cassette subfamily F protein uup
LGPNGAGKKPLLRLLLGAVEPDGGEVLFSKGTHVSLLPQEVPQDTHGSVAEVVTNGLSPQHEPESTWQGQQQVERILGRMSLNAQARFEALSSGMKRRVLLAQSLVSSPDLLLLDEPTACCPGPSARRST